MRNPRLGYGMATTAAFVWAATSPGLSYLMANFAISPLTAALWRDVFIAIACLLGVLVTRPSALRMPSADLRGFALTGVVSVGIYHAFFVSSVALNGAALAIVLIYLYPAFVSLGAALFFGETISRRQIAAIILALVGCALLVRAYDPTVLSLSWPGVLIGVASAITHAGYVLYNQRQANNHSPWVALALTMAFGSLTLVIITTLFEGPQGLVAVGGGLAPWLILIGLALGPTMIGYLLFTASLRHISGQVASLVVVVEAPIATLAAVLLLGERLEMAQIVGMGLILLAAILPYAQPRRAPAPSPAPASSQSA